MSRLSVLIIAVAALLCGWLSRGPARYIQSAAELIQRRADSLALERSRHRLDSLELEAFERRASDSLRLDSLREAFRRRPIREVVRWLPGGRDTLRVPPVVESVMVAAPMLRETADSLATCQVQRSAALDSSALWRVRESMAREALDLCRTRPQVVGDTNPPSRSTWAAVGAAGALLGVSAILLLVR